MADHRPDEQKSSIIQAQLAAIVESSDDAIISKTLDGTITSWNHAAEKLFGYTRNEAVGKPMLMIFPPDRVNEERDILAKIARGEMVRHYETVRIRKDGQPIAVSVTVSPLKDNAGKIIGASKIARDITERKRGEAILQRQASLFEQTYDAVLVWQWNGPITYWNRGAEQMYGFQRTEALGHISHELLKTTTASGLSALVPTLEQQGRWEGELEHIAKDGHRVIVETRMVLVRKPNDVYVLEVNRDITGRKRAEEVQARLAAIVQGMNEACFALDGEWRFTFVNDRCETLLHHRRNEMLGKPLWEVFARLVGTPMEKSYRRAMTERAPVSFEALSPIAQRWLDIRLFPSGNGLAAFLLDIHERKQAEESVQKSQEQLRSLIEQAPVSIAMFDRDMRYIITSRRWVSEYGKGRDHLAGLSHYEIIPDMPAAWKEVHRKGLAGEFFKNDEDLWIQADGSKRWLRWTVQPWRDAHDRIAGIIISTEDITERKTAREKVQDQLQELQRWHETMLGREGRILELKSEVNELLTQQQQLPRYSSPTAP